METPETAHLNRARALTRVMDTAVRVPGTRIELGLDALLGLLPGLGDFAGAAMAGYLVALATRQGAPTSVVLRMLGNVGIDALVGSVPLLGDAFDVGWKANSRNLALLERHLEQPVPTQKASRAAVAVVLLVLALLAVGGLLLAVWIVNLLLQPAR